MLCPRLKLQGISLWRWTTNCPANTLFPTSRGYYWLRRWHSFQALVISRPDYCNSLLAGLPASAIRPLQLIQDTAAQLFFKLPKFSHTMTLFSSLHWLPVAARIHFKTLAYRSVNGSDPSYIQNMVKPYTLSVAPSLLQLGPRYPLARTPLIAIMAIEKV